MVTVYQKLAFWCLLANVWTKFHPALAELLPSYSDAYDYKLTLDPGGNRYTSNERPGAFWKLSHLDQQLKSTPSLYHASNRYNAAPNGVVFAEDGRVFFDAAGVDTILDNATDQYNASDKSVRLTGEVGSCLKFSGFSSSMDTCLADPLSCSLNDENNIKGLSMSLWVNIPNSFTEGYRYILDTGGSTNGSKGVAIRMKASDGIKYVHEIEFIVSIGPKYWKAILKGITVAQRWNNIGFRWSQNLATDGIEYGLQVFVGGRSAAWKRLPGLSTGTSTGNVVAPSDVTMTLGCRLDGKMAQTGLYDNLAFWYWRLRDMAADMKPLNPSERYEVNYFTGGRILSTEEERTRKNQWLDTRGPDGCFKPDSEDLLHCRPDTWNPWPFMIEDFKLQGDPIEKFLHQEVNDASPSVSDDCDINTVDPSDWGDGALDGVRHPIDCADTAVELKHALSFHREGYTFHGVELLRSMVRVLNRDKSLEADDVTYLYTAVLPLLEQKILSGSGNSSISSQEHNTIYIHGLIYMLSSLSSRKLFGSHTMSDWANRIEVLLRSIAWKLDQKTAVIVGSNHTVSSVIHIPTADMRADVNFPVYDVEITNENVGREKLYQFMRGLNDPLSIPWSGIRDRIKFFYSFFRETFTPQTISPAAEAIVITKLHNAMHANFPASLHPEIKFTGNELTTGWRINSNIISLSIGGRRLNDSTPLDYTEANIKRYPVHFYVHHLVTQDERPVKKLAILCVHWDHSAIPATGDKQGAWDTKGCSLEFTNDTYSECKCAHLSDYAILMEQRNTPGTIDHDGYVACYVLYGISILCLLVFIIVILMIPRLHYELHIINMNIAFCLLCALTFYVSTLEAYKSRIPCLLVSAFMHYSYTATYTWCVLLAHYVFRAITKGKLTEILFTYCLLGYVLPAILVVVMTISDVTKYGTGERCLGAQEGSFLWIYIGIFIFLCAIVCPLFLIAICNAGQIPVEDPEDCEDIKWALCGVIAFWPFVMVVWVLAIFVYLIPQNTMLFDFLFELFNSLQGIVIFLLLGLLIPSFRNSFCCCGRKKVSNEQIDDWKIRRKKIYVDYVG